MIDDADRLLEVDGARDVGCSDLTDGMTDRGHGHDPTMDEQPRKRDLHSHHGGLHDDRTIDPADLGLGRDLVEDRPPRQSGEQTIDLVHRSGEEAVCWQR